jgi:hypothetical protein
VGNVAERKRVVQVYKEGVILLDGGMRERRGRAEAGKRGREGKRDRERSGREEREGYYTEGPTLCIGNVAERKRVVQVYREGVILLHPVCGQRGRG